MNFKCFLKVIGIHCTLTYPGTRKKLREIKKKPNSKIHVNVHIKTVMLRPKKKVPYSKSFINEVPLAGNGFSQMQVILAVVYLSRMSEIQCSKVSTKPDLAVTVRSKKEHHVPLHAVHFILITVLY